MTNILVIVFLGWAIGWFLSQKEREQKEILEIEIERIKEKNEEIIDRKNEEIFLLNNTIDVLRKNIK